MDKSQKRQNYLHYIKIKLFSRFNINNEANRAKKHSLERKKTWLNMYASLMNCLVNINLLTMTMIISTSEVILISMGFWRYLFSPGLKYRYLPLFRSCITPSCFYEKQQKVKQRSASVSQQAGTEGVCTLSS